MHTYAYTLLIFVNMYTLHYSFPYTCILYKLLISVTCILYITHFRIHVYFTLLISVYMYTLHYPFSYTCILYITHFRIHVYFTLLIFVYMYTLHYSFSYTCTLYITQIIILQSPYLQEEMKGEARLKYLR